MHGKFARGGRGSRPLGSCFAFAGCVGAGWVVREGRGGGLEIEAETPAKFPQDSLI